MSDDYYLCVWCFYVMLGHCYRCRWLLASCGSMVCHASILLCGVVYYVLCRLRYMYYYNE